MLQTAYIRLPTLPGAISESSSGAQALQASQLGSQFPSCSTVVPGVKSGLARQGHSLPVLKHGPRSLLETAGNAVPVVKAGMEHRPTEEALINCLLCPFAHLLQVCCLHMLWCRYSSIVVSQLCNNISLSRIAPSTNVTYYLSIVQAQIRQFLQQPIKDGWVFFEHLVRSEWPDTYTWFAPFHHLFCICSPLPSSPLQELTATT